MFRISNGYFLINELSSCTYNGIFVTLTLPTKVAWKNKNIKATTAQPSFLRWRCSAVHNNVIAELAANNNISGYNNSDDGNSKYTVARLNYLVERYSHAEANVSPPPPPAPQHRQTRQKKERQKERKGKKGWQGFPSPNANTHPLRLRGPPPRLWLKCNRLLKLGRPVGVVTLSPWE